MIAVTALSVVALLGGTVAIKLPADEAVEALEVQFAQTWQQRQMWEQQQHIYHKQQEVEDLQFRMRYLSNEINRINSIPQYLSRGVTPEEEWQVQQYKEEWSILQKRLQRMAGDE